MTYCLFTKISIDECLRRLREQVQPMTFWNRNFYFAKRTSKVVGKFTEKEFILEASRDLFSKRMKGMMIERPSGTIIEFVWEKPFWSRFYGSYKFDEEEIIAFLKEWLDADFIDNKTEIN
jgi:hypothetical protein